LESQGWLLVDDPTPQTGRQDLEAALATGRNVAVTDPHLCRSEAREAAARIFNRPGLSIEWTFFANDPETCRKNVAGRKDGRSVEATIRLYSKLYEIPEGAETLPVWS
jgi:predicted kinase